MNNMTELEMHIYSETIRDYVQSINNCKTPGVIIISLYKYRKKTGDDRGREARKSDDY